MRSLVETVKMMHNSSQNLLETLALSFVAAFRHAVFAFLERRFFAFLERRFPAYCAFAASAPSAYAPA